MKLSLITILIAIRKSSSKRGNQNKMVKNQKKKANPYEYDINKLKGFSEFATSDIMAMNIVELTRQTKSPRVAHEIAKCKIRKMFVFGYAKALYDIDKKKNRKFIKDLLKRAEQLDFLMVSNFKQSEDLRTKK